ncbi:MAG: peptide chain release factor N(5)-glutamine methyltransferase [Planctomycetales bacterium]|nr:peptide chain release factor N(5)-glutamine methyltransferase [Planctomycetales bacterium]
MTAREFRKAAAARLRAAGVPDPAREADGLLAKALGVPRAAALGETGALPPGVVTRGEAFVARRCDGWSFAHVVGEREFYGLALEVTEDVLAPRPETEILVGRALALLKLDAARGEMGSDPITVADVGTGSGAIACAVAANAPGVRVLATDVSPAAVEVARRNAARCGVADRVEVLVGDLGGPLRRAGAAGRVALLCANLPYVARRDAASLPPEVRREPEVAVFGTEEDGLGFVRNLLRDLPVLLASGGAALLEIGAGQESAARAAIEAAGLGFVAVHPDLAGIPRVVEVRR